MVQVVDSNGDKATEAVVNFKVYFLNSEEEVWEVIESGLMTHIGDGIYQASFSPDEKGEYTFYSYSSNPKFHESYTYFVEIQQHSGATYLYGWNADSRMPPTQGLEETIVNIANPEESNAVRGYKAYWLRFWQTNNEAATKDVTVRLEVDNSGYNIGSFTAPSAHLIYLYWDIMYGTFKYVDVTADGCPPPMMGPSFWDNTNKVMTTNPLEGKRLGVYITFNSAPGTNQGLMWALINGRSAVEVN
jgi:hypothetical protein